MAQTPDQRPDDMTADPDGAALPAELQALDARLVADGAHWQRSAPDGRNLPAWARATLKATPAPPAVAPPPHRQLLDAHDERPADPKGPHGLMDSQTPNNSRYSTRWRGIAGGVAAALVVGALAGLLIHNASQRGAGASATATPPTPGATGTPTFDPSQPLIAGKIPVVAPSNPNLVFVMANNIPQRSTNGGKTYSALSTPKSDISPVDDSWIAVSPLDPTHLFVTISGQKNGQMCLPNYSQSGALAHGGVDFSGYTDCSEQFFSANGGQSWTLLNLPGGDVLGGMTAFRLTQSAFETPAYVLQAQGQRLYAGAGYSTQGGDILASFGARIMTSADGGATWSLVDQGLANQGLVTCDFAASPTGSTIYAITVANQSCGNEGVPAMGLYRSDNLGQTWVKAGNLAIASEGGMVVAPNGALYLYAPSASPASHTINMTTGPQYALVSQNKGATFSAAPSSGFPSAGDATSLYGPVAMLSDGSAVFVTLTGLYSWKAGQPSWTKIAPSGPNSLAAVIVTPNPHGGDTLTVSDITGHITTLHLSA